MARVIFMVSRHGLFHSIRKNNRFYSTIDTSFARFHPPVAFDIFRSAARKAMISFELPADGI
jgi:hypothetical protein